MADPTTDISKNLDVYAPAVAALRGKIYSDNSGLLADDVPDIQYDAMAIQYYSSSKGNPVNYVDKAGFHTEFDDELHALSQVEELIDRGQAHIHNLYTFRCVSRAIPSVASEELSDKEKEAINLRTFQVLAPCVKKLVDVIAFSQEAVKMFTDKVLALARDVMKTVVPEGYYDALVKVIDLLQKIDNLKDTKSSLKQDFFAYRRAMGLCGDALKASGEHDLKKLKAEEKLVNNFVNNQDADGTMYRNLMSFFG